MVRRADAALICAAIQQYRCTHGFLFAPTADAIAEINADGVTTCAPFAVRYRIRAGRRWSVAMRVCGDDAVVATAVTETVA